MKNEAKSERQKVDNGNNQQTKIEGRRSNLTVDQPNLKWKSHLTATPKRGFVRGIEDRFCKGPPGRSHSPGGSRGHPPEIKVNPPNGLTVLAQSIPLSSRREGLGVSSAQPKTVNNQYINTNINSNFYKHLNFKNMKKQIFILIMALFAVSTAFGQILVKNSEVKVWALPTCTGTPSKPAAGEQYAYKVTIPGTYTGYNGDGVYDWYVTQDLNLITGTIQSPPTNFSVAASGSSTYHSSSNPGTTNEILITWTAAAIATAKPFFLVVKYTETNLSGVLQTCASENLKVYIVEPQNTFWLDINPSTSAGVVPTPAALQVANYTYDICAAGVKTAIIANAAGSAVEYTFNDNIIYAVIHAAGYTGNWVPTLKLSGLVDNQAVTSVAWSAPGPLTGTFTTAAVGTFGNGTYTSATPLPATNTGTDILLTITIANNNHEALIDQGIKISIDGSYTAGGVTYNDKSDATANCSDEANDADFVVETIKARPAINPTTPATFIDDSATHKN